MFLDAWSESDKCRSRRPNSLPTLLVADGRDESACGSLWTRPLRWEVIRPAFQVPGCPTSSDTAERLHVCRSPGGRCCYRHPRQIRGTGIMGGVLNHHRELSAEFDEKRGDVMEAMSL